MTKVATVLLLLAGLLVETSLAFCVIPSQRRFNTHVVGSAEDSFMGGNREIEDILSVGGDPFFFTPDGVVEMEEKQEGPSYSFVEGSTFDSQLEEIMAMGGDPSFFAQDGAVEEGKTSFMEGSSFDSQRELIEAMGGDSFFFTQDGVVEEEEAPPAAFMSSSFRAMMENTAEADVTPERFATDGKGHAHSRQEPTDSIAFEWDGTVDDDAHLGFL